MDDIVKEFLLESTENLDQLDRDLVTLEASPGDRELISAIFRVLHTIKGTCGFLGFGRLEKVAHAGENLLGKLREGELSLNAEITSGLLACVDAVRGILSVIEASGNDGENDYPELCEILRQLQCGQTPVAADLSGQMTSPATSAESTPAQVVPDAEPEGQTQPAESPSVAAPVCHIPENISSMSTSVEKVVHEKEATVVQAQAHPAGASVSDTAIRVDVGVLDKLMNLVGELVLSRNQIIQLISTKAETSHDSIFVNASQRLNLITSELQEGIMKTRMQPIGNVWSKFPRVVRDLSNSLGKKIKLEMIGKETELDKTLIEAIKDPLTHIIRNSVDHGIETPDKRREKGKQEEGTLRLIAYHEGGQVNIEIVDDGAGIDPNRIREKAISKGLVTADRVARMSDQEVVNLVFLPGFSTAEKVTNVSGRGVGMDVVRTNIERINGSIDIQNRPGLGMTLRIKIPLTLAIIPALLVICNGERYAIPQSNLLELVRVSCERKKGGVEMFEGVPVYRLRGKLLPLVYLREVLGLPKQEEGELKNLNVVVVQAGEQPFGLVVDRINDTQEIVVKPLGKQLKGVHYYAGATIMGDGWVALILDVLSIAQKVHLVNEAKDGAHKNNMLSTHSGFSDLETVLVLRGAGDSRLAVPLSSVARLEEFNWSTIEQASGQLLVQYRGGIMPIHSLSSAMSGGGYGGGFPDGGDPNHKVHVVVYSNGRANIGFMVDRILDIVQTPLRMEKAGCRSGVLGTAVIQGKVMEVISLEAVVGQLDPNFLTMTAAEDYGAGGEQTYQEASV